MFDIWIIIVASWWKVGWTSESPTKLWFHSLSFKTHQNEIPTPTPMHVSIRMYLFIHIYVFIYTHICVYVYISMFMYVYRWIDRWMDGYVHTTQRLHIYVNTIQRSWIPGFASLSCYARMHACTHTRTHTCTKLLVYIWMHTSTCTTTQTQSCECVCVCERESVYVRECVCEGLCVRVCVWGCVRK